MDFERNLIKILCISSSDTVRGLQWALDRQEFSDRRYSLTHSSLAQIQQSEIPEFDCTVMTIDLGQPVPLENLRKLAHKPGLCAFTHPTPQQLLSLAEMPRWVGATWDGVSFEKIITKIDELAQRLMTEMKLENFIEVFRAWERNTIKEPDILEWTNPPDSYTESKNFYLDSQSGQVLIGDVRDGMSVRVGAVGIQRPMAELHWYGGEWRFKALDAQWKPKIQAPDRALQHGDTIQIGDMNFLLKLNRNSEKLQQMARRFGLLESPLLPSSETNANRTLAQFSKDLLVGGLSGELRLTSGLKHGTLFFEDGFCNHATTGSVRGQKALMRMWGWENPKWRFNPDKASEWKSLHLNISEYDRLYRQWLENWRKVAHLTPPPQLRLTAHAGQYLHKQDWDLRECQVMASVCEYGMVRDILNHCRLDDITIIETLIQMRRKGLIVLAA